MRASDRPPIAPARAEDAAAIAALQARCFDDAWGCPAIEGLLAAPGAIALVAEGRGRAGLAGFSLARVVAGEAEIVCLGVAPERRRQGIGRALVDATARAAAERNAEALFLEVAEDNHAARSLYRAAGFVAVGRRPGYYRRAGGPAVAALILRAALSPPSRA